MSDKTDFDEAVDEWFEIEGPLSAAQMRVAAHFFRRGAIAVNERLDTRSAWAKFILEDKWGGAGEG